MSFLAYRSSLSCQTEKLEVKGKMIYWKNLVFNSLQVNTWLVYKERGSCIIVDPACAEDFERQLLLDFISENELKPEMILATHAHFDHLAGVDFVREKFNIPFYGHRDDLTLLQFARQQGELYGFNFDVDPPEFDRFINDEDIIEWGGGAFKALHVPGHSKGSLAYYFEELGFVIVGDVLFRESIGRTDLPGGDYDTLIHSINTKLLVLDDATRVFPGHGAESDISYEKAHNPFL